MSRASSDDRSRARQHDDAAIERDGSHAWIVEALAAMIYYSEDHDMKDVADPLISAMEVVAPKIAAPRKMEKKIQRGKASVARKSAKVVPLHQ